MNQKMLSGYANIAQKDYVLIVVLILDTVSHVKVFMKKK